MLRKSGLITKKIFSYCHPYLVTKNLTLFLIVDCTYPRYFPMRYLWGPINRVVPLMFFVVVVFFVLHSFPTFVAYPAITCFYKGFLGRWKFNLNDSRASCCGSKHIPGPSVCLNHTGIHNY